MENEKIEENKKKEEDMKKFDEEQKKYGEEKKRKEEEKRKKEEIQLEKDKKLIIENQKNFRKKIEDINNNVANSDKNENNINKKLKQTLEDMCNYGNIILKEIEKDKKSLQKEFIYLDDLKSKDHSSDKSLFALKLLAQTLENNGIKTVIDKEPTNISDDESITNLQFIVNGLSYKKKYTLSFDFGEEKNEKILEKGKEYDKFVKELKGKLSRDYDINSEEIIIIIKQRD